MILEFYWRYSYSAIRSIELALNVSKLVRCSVGLLLVKVFDPVRFPRNSKRRMKEAIASPKQSHSAVRHNTVPVSRSTRKYAVMPRKRSRHFAMPPLPPLLFPANDVWGSSAEIPYWWRVTTQIWVVFVIGWSELSTTQKHHWALPSSDTSSVRNSILMTCHYPNLGSVCDWVKWIINHSEAPLSITQ